MGPSKVSLVCLAFGNRIEMEGLKAFVFAVVGSDHGPPTLLVWVRRMTW